MSSKPPSAYEVFFGPTNRVVTLKLIRYSLWMVLFPLGTFYFFFYIVYKQNQAMLGWCGIYAVIATNIVIAQYVRMAWLEDTHDKKRLQDNHSKNGVYYSNSMFEKRTD